MQLLMKKRDKHFKLYCNEGDPILKVSKQYNFKNTRIQKTMLLKLYSKIIHKR